MKNYKIVGLSFLFAVCLCVPGRAQIVNADQINRDSLPTESVIDLSPAEFQSLLEKLIRHKRAQLQASSKAQPPSVPKELRSADEAEPSSGRESKETRLSIIRDTFTMPSDYIEKKDLEAYQAMLEQELASIREDIKGISVPTATDTVVYKSNSGEMKEMRQQLARIEEQLKSPVTVKSNTKTDQDEDLKKVQDQLTRIEQQLKSPVIVKSNDKTDTVIYKNQDADLKEMRQQLARIERQLVVPVVIQNKGDTIVTPNRPATMTPESIAYWNLQFSQLSRQIEEIKAADKKTPESSSPSVSIDTAQFAILWNRQVEELKKMIREMKPEEQPVREKIIVKTPPPDTTMRQLKETIAGKERQRILFGNNKVTIGPAYMPVLDQSIAYLRRFGALDILLTGYASPTGSAIYNQTLSQRRAESVKKYLISKGIHPSRIFTEYHGIDYQAVSPAEGRRVDLLLLIRQ